MWRRTATTALSTMTMIDRLRAPQGVLREEYGHETAERRRRDSALCRRAVRAPEHEAEREGVHGHEGGEHAVGEIPAQRERRGRRMVWRGVDWVGSIWCGKARGWSRGRRGTRYHACRGKPRNARAHTSAAKESSPWTRSRAA